MIQSHLHVKHSFTLSPHRVMLCYLLFEARQSQLSLNHHHQHSDPSLTDSVVHNLAQFCSQHIEEQGAPEQSLEDLCKALQNENSNLANQNINTNSTQVVLYKALYQLLPQGIQSQQMMMQNNQSLEELACMVSDNFCLDVLFSFFKDKLPKLIQQASEHQVHIQNERRPRRIMVVFNSEVVMYLRRCELAFSQMLFDKLENLCQCMKAYLKGQSYEYDNCQYLVGKWVQGKLARVERDTMNTNQKVDSVQEHSFAKTDSQTTYKQYLVEAVEAQIFGDDQQALSKFHQYFDYNMKEKTTRYNAETDTHEFGEWVTKVHQPAAQLAGVYYRLGHYDQALITVMESIKFSQSINDSRQILQSLVWLRLILAALGNTNLEKKILEHICYQSYQHAQMGGAAGSARYIFVIACMNLAVNSSTTGTGQISNKVKQTLKALQVQNQGPLYNKLLQATTFQISKVHEEQQTKNHLNNLLPLTLLRKHQILLSLGQKELAFSLISELQSYDCPGPNQPHYLQQASSDLINGFLDYIPSLPPVKALKQLSQILIYCKNPKLCHFDTCFYLIQAKQSMRLFGRSLARPKDLKNQPAYLTSKVLLAAGEVKECLKICQMHGFQQVKQECFLKQSRAMVPSQLDQAKVSLSHIIASCGNSIPNTDIIAKVKLICVEIFLLENQPAQAMGMLGTIMPQCLDQNDMQLEALQLMARISIQFNLLDQAVTQMQQALSIALDLTDLQAMQKISYAISIVCSIQLTQLQQQTQTQTQNLGQQQQVITVNQTQTQLLNYRKEQAAGLWLVIDKYLKEQHVEVCEVKQPIEVRVQKEIARTQKIIEMCQEYVKNVGRSQAKISARGGLVTGTATSTAGNNSAGGSHSVGVVTRSQALQQRQQAQMMQQQQNQQQLRS